MEPHSLLYILLVGLVAGALASRVVIGKGLGCLGDTIVGLAGAFIGGFLFNQVRAQTVVVDGTLDQVVVAFIGAVLLLVVVRLGRRHEQSR